MTTSSSNLEDIILYTPEHFSVADRSRIVQFIHDYSFGQLISEIESRPFVTHLPFLLNAEANLLQGHIARANPHWQNLDNRQVLVVFMGPHGYVSPSWYQEPGVPTWNYQAVHVYGKVRCISNPGQLSELVQRLTDHHESRLAEPWRAEFESSRLRGIMGIEIAIEDIHGKFKLSQNRSDQERLDVAGQLHKLGNSSLAEAMLAELRHLSDN